MPFPLRPANKLDCVIKETNHLFTIQYTVPVYRSYTHPMFPGWKSPAFACGTCLLYPSEDDWSKKWIQDIVLYAYTFTICYDTHKENTEVRTHRCYRNSVILHWYDYVLMLIINLKQKWHRWTNLTKSDMKRMWSRVGPISVLTWRLGDFKICSSFSTLLDLNNMDFIQQLLENL